MLSLAALLPARVAAAAASASDKKAYIHTLALADRVRIAVYQEDDLTSVTRIDARGKITCRSSAKSPSAA
ncbi:MAG: hypothetical protein WDM96_12175 [Lacunisphaera sp.]